MKIGYFTYGYDNVPVKESLTHLAKCGYDGAELCVWEGYPADVDALTPGKIRKIKRLLESLNLEISAVGSHTQTLVKNEEERRKSLERLRKNIDLAVALGSDVVETSGGSAPEGWTEEDTWRCLVENAQEHAAHAKEAGLKIAFEPHIGAFIDSPEKSLRLVESVGSDAFGMNMDESHFEIQGMDMDEAVKMLAPVSFHTHLKDTRGRYPDYQFLIPGEGDYDTRRFVEGMRENGYDGYITAEIGMMRRRKPDYDPFQAAEMSYRTILNVFRELELR